jgi:hypothetical protein
MSVGSWMLSASGATTGLAAANALTGLFGGAAALAKPAAALLGLPLSTYHEGSSGTLARTAKVLTALGGLAIGAWGHRRRSAAVLGGTALLAGAAAERFAVFRAGFASAKDPKFTVGPQRERVEAGRGHGASQKAAA